MPQEIDFYKDIKAMKELLTNTFDIPGIGVLEERLRNYDDLLHEYNLLDQPSKDALPQWLGKLFAEISR